jgi:hypothetical protein
MIKVWMKSMQTDATPRGDWTTQLDFSVYLDRGLFCDRVEQDKQRQEAYAVLKLGKPLFLVNQDELGGKEEIQRLKELVEIVEFERDQARKKAATLKAVVQTLMDRL